MSHDARSDTVRVGELVIDRRRWQVTVGDRAVALSTLEFRLLAYLAGRIGQVVPYDDLLRHVWGYQPEKQDRKLVIRCVSRLRKMLGEDADHPEYIVNGPEVGYRLRDQEEWEERFGSAR